MQRSKKIVLLSHCILNANSKIIGYSQYPGVFKEIVDIIDRLDLGMIQLPCPEILACGMKRWGKTKDQYDTKHYREMCRDILRPVVEQIYAYDKVGYEIVGVIGVDGSPSCGVNKTCLGKSQYGSISNFKTIEEIADSIIEADDPGIFMEEFMQLLTDEGFQLPFIGINEEDVFDSIESVENFLVSHTEAQ